MATAAAAASAVAGLMPVLRITLAHCTNDGNVHVCVVADSISDVTILNNLTQRCRDTDRATTIAVSHE